MLGEVLGEGVCMMRVMTRVEQRLGILQNGDHRVSFCFIYYFSSQHSLDCLTFHILLLPIVKRRLNAYICNLGERSIKTLASKNACCVTQVYSDARMPTNKYTVSRWMVALEYQKPC